jgi:hypothetical protein
MGSLNAVVAGLELTDDKRAPVFYYLVAMPSPIVRRRKRVLERAWDFSVLTKSPVGAPVVVIALRYNSHDSMTD